MQNDNVSCEKHFKYDGLVMPGSLITFLVMIVAYTQTFTSASPILFQISLW